MDDLTNKVILVTGASKGIGAAIATRLGDAGASVIAHYGSDLAGAQKAVAGIPEGRKKLISADLGDKGEVDRLWRDAEDWRGRIDVFVNNAAVMRTENAFDATDVEWDNLWDEALAVNVLAPARLMRNAVRHYEKNGGGVIITMSSWAAQRGSGSPGLIAYSASKAAVMAASKTIARHYGKDNILVYMIAPGVVRTRMSEDFAKLSGGEDAVTAGLAMQEWVPPEDLANLVVFLSSGECKHLSGATLDVNGASYLR